jgi:hypothetical protein
MAPALTGRRVLIKVVQQYGPHGAAARLGISPTLLDRLLTGLTNVPDSLLIRAIDLLPEDAPSVPGPFAEVPSNIPPIK